MAQYMESTRYAGFRSWAMGKSAKQILGNKAISRSPYGANIAHVLSQAETEEQFDQIFRIAEGNPDEYEKLRM